MLRPNGPGRPGRGNRPIRYADGRPPESHAIGAAVCAPARDRGMHYAAERRYPIDQTSQKIDFVSKVKNFNFACFNFAFEVKLQS